MPPWMSRSSSLPSSGVIHHWRMPEVLRRYNSLSWIKYPLALRVRHQVLVSSSGIITSHRYSAIGFCQSCSEPVGLITTTNAFACPGSSVVGPTGAPGLAPDISDGPPSADGGPGTETGLPSSGEPSGTRARTSSSSQIEGLNRSYTNTPGGGDSRLDPSWAKASAVSLSPRWM
jgi:hypothetical protein